MVHSKAGRTTPVVAAVAVLLSSACSGLQDGPTTPGSASFAASSSELIPPPASCAAVQAVQPGAADGEYLIAPQPGQAYSVWCADMATATPSEYLTLVNTGSGRNFSSGHHGSFTGSDEWTTEFTRLRIDPASTKIDIGDTRFSTHTGGSALSYASAAGCYGYDSGSANIDLGGTPFTVRSDFRLSGWYSSGSVNGDMRYNSGGGSQVFTVSDEQVVNLTGGGSCGGISAAFDFHEMFVGEGGYALQLHIESVTLGDLCALTRAAVSHQGIANALCAKLDAAAASAARGNENAKRGQLGAYVNQLKAQSGKAVSAADAARLSALAATL